jgi:hypothetical protein
MLSLLGDGLVNYKEIPNYYTALCVRFSYDLQVNIRKAKNFGQFLKLLRIGMFKGRINNDYSI